MRSMPAADRGKVEVHESRGAGGAEADPHAGVGATAGDVEHVGPHQRIAAGEDEHRGSEFAQLIDKGECLDLVEFVAMPFRLGLGAAMAAGERAGAGDLPEDEEGSFGEGVGGGGLERCDHGVARRLRLSGPR